MRNGSREENQKKMDKRGRENRDRRGILFKFTYIRSYLITAGNKDKQG